MKKKLLITGLGVASVLGFHALTATYQAQTFLKGVAVVVEQPASASVKTLTSGAVSVPWTNKIGQLITAGTNSVGQSYGAWDQPVVVFGDANGNVAATAVTVLIPGAGTTNTVLFTLKRSADGVNYDDTAWAFTTPASVSAGAVNLTTNVPTWFLQGAQNIKIASIAFATNSAGYTNALQVLLFSGNVP